MAGLHMAKPIIEIMIGVQDLAEASNFLYPLSEIGYEPEAVSQ